MEYVFLDVGKFVASIFVIFSHTEPLMDVSPLASYLLADGLLRQAVPFFFVTSGFFLARRWPVDEALPWRAALRSVRRILVLYAVWLCPYAPVLVWSLYEMWGSWHRALLVTGQELVFGMYHLWFFPALAEAVLLLAVLSRFLRWRQMLLLGGVLYAGATVVYEMGWLPMDAVYRHYVRGALFFAVPWVMLGVYFSRVGRLPRRWLLLVYAAGTALLLLECVGDFYRLQHAPMDLFLSLVVCVPALFLLLRDAAAGAWLSARALHLRRMSTLVYGVHAWPVVVLLGVPSVAQRVAAAGVTGFHFWLLMLVLAWALAVSCLVLRLARRWRWLHWLY